MRAPFQVLLIPFVKERNGYKYAVFQRADMNIWQAIAGGGEDNETPLEAVKREAMEEASIEGEFIRLSSMCTIPGKNIHGLIWGKDVVIAPEIAFGVELKSKEIKLSDEHREYEWVSCDEAIKRLKYDSNKSAVWELNYRLKNGLSGIEKNNKSIRSYLCF